MPSFIDGALTAWFLLTAASLVFLIWDLMTNTPAGRVMKLAWVLVVLYTGPIGLFIYLLSCRQPLPGTHDAFITTHWKQATGSLLHCVAGDATGIIISAIVVYHFGLPNGIDLIIEYLFAFIVGLFVFQALFMLSMYNGNYWLAVRKTFFAETVSMNMVMVGMIPTMVILMHLLPGAADPKHALFWGVMSVATMAGMITAYPINSWMVARGLKHGMMSAIPAGNKDEMNMQTEMSHDMKMTHDMDQPMSMPMDKPLNAPMDKKMDMTTEKTSGEKTSGTQHEHHESKLSTGLFLASLLGTSGALLVALVITNIFVPISFTSGV